MTRILINDLSPEPDKRTGLSVYTWKIVEALLRSGANDYVLATNRSEPSVPPAILAGVAETVFRRVPSNEARAMIRNTLELPGIARRHGCAGIFHPQPTAMLAGMGSSIVVVHDLYRVTNPELFPWRQRWQWHLLVAHGLRHAGALIAVSGATRDAVVAAYPSLADRVTVVHEASPLDPPQGAPDPAKLIDGRYGLVVANVTPNKNLGLLVDALGLLARSGDRPRILVAGRDESDILRNLLAATPGIDLQHVGPVDDATLRALYAGAHAYINTSLAEGFCLPILEAQSMAVPVICSDLPVLREVAGEGALFVDPHRPEHLAEAIRRLWTNAPLHAALREGARSNEARFSWDKAARETEAVFARTLAARSPG